MSDMTHFYDDDCEPPHHMIDLQAALEWADRVVGWKHVPVLAEHARLVANPNIEAAIAKARLWAAGSGLNDYAADEMGREIVAAALGTTEGTQ